MDNITNPPTKFRFSCDYHRCNLLPSYRLSLPAFVATDPIDGDPILGSGEYTLDLSNMFCPGAEATVERWIAHRDEHPERITSNYRAEEQEYVDKIANQCDWKMYVWTVNGWTDTGFLND